MSDKLAAPSLGFYGSSALIVARNDTTRRNDLPEGSFRQCGLLLSASPVCCCQLALSHAPRCPVTAGASSALLGPDAFSSFTAGKRC